MFGPARRHRVYAACWLALAPFPSLAQTAPPAPPQEAPAPQLPATPGDTLDPASPMSELPGIGLDWPDLATAPADTDPASTERAQIAGDTRYSYTVTGIDGVGSALLRQRFDAASTLRANRGDTANAAQLDRRAREDSALLESLLRAEGYYDARVVTRVEPKAGEVAVTLEAEPGAIYKFAGVTLAGVEKAGAKTDDLTQAFGLTADTPVNSDTIAAAETRLKVAVGEEGFAFARVGEPEIVVDRASRTATLNLTLDPGTQRRFGKIVMPVPRVFGPDHVQDIARFTPGQEYNASALIDLRRALIQTGLVSSVKVDPVEGATPEMVDIQVALEPAPPRTIAGELGYGTGEGARAEVSWTHRNLFPPEGALTVRGVLGTKEQLGSLVFRRNNFRGRDRVLTLQLSAAHTERDAYEADTLQLAGSLERQTNIFFQKAWTWSLGAELVATDERDVILSTGAPRRRTYFIGALPTSLTYDGSDDLLNPTHGFRLSGRFSPELSLVGKAFGYSRIQLDGSVYQPITPTVIMAGRIRLGTIVGAPRDAIAPSRRFYAGGGASVRGYGYQSIGPRDLNNDPIGGRSLTEFSIEARVKAFGNFGIVPFFDGGNIYTSPLPKFSSFRYGAGVGVRYYSNFGPIRVDVGTPLNPQRGDSRIGVYVSLGQAFLSEEADAPPPQTVPARRLWIGRFLVLALLIVAVVIATAALLDTSTGHRFVADQIAKQRPSNGLRYSIGRIDGSLYGKATLIDVRVRDPKGLVFQAPRAELDWRPFAWAAGVLNLRSLVIPRATLLKMPFTLKSGKKTPILPSFDISIGELRIDRLDVAPAVTGIARTGSLKGSAEIRSGRALIDLAAVVQGSDRLALRLDAEPDKNKFDFDLSARGTARGVLARLTGVARPLAAEVHGDGDWKTWRGTAQTDAGDARIVDLRLSNDAGRYALAGSVAPASIVGGKLQRLSTPRILVNGAATLANRRLDGNLSLRSPALSLDTTGEIDLATSAYRNVRIAGRLLRPSALFPNMTGRNIQLRAIVDGAFATAGIDYRLTADQVQFDNTGFGIVRAAGRLRLSDPPVTVPIDLTAARVTGVGDVAGGILRNLRVTGPLRVTAREVTGDALKLSSDKLNGRITLFLDLKTGRYEVGLTGGLQRYLIPGIGLVDVQSQLSVVPGPNGKGTRVVGRGSANVVRLDNAFFASLTRGLPRITTGLERGNDGILYMRGLVLTSPGLKLSGNGYRRRDGTFFFEGNGSQVQYGPLTLKLDGRIEKPTIDLTLRSPNATLGLKDVRAHLDPTVEGFTFTAAGGSRLGAFTGTGAILLPPGGAARIQIARLDVAGTRSSGALDVVPGGFDGRLDVAGNGLTGNLTFKPQGDLQHIDILLDARAAQLADGLRIRRGHLQAGILLDPAGTTIDATLTAQGLRRGSLSLGRLAANAKLVDGVGEIRAAIAGSRGRAFAIQSVIQVAADRYTVQAQGTVDRRPIALVTPAILVRDGDGWRLQSTKLTFAGGEAQVGGRFSSAETAFEASLARMPLSVLDIGYPGLGLGGSATGTLRYAARTDGAPTGTINMTVRGLTRSGLVLSSKPIDVGIAGVLDANKAAARAVMASGGQTIGRAQLMLSPLASGDLVTRLANANLFGQLRYSGPADTLWRLTGIELFDLSGPVAIGADLTGRLADPQIRGSLRTETARIESGVTGTVLRNVAASGRFGGSRLVIDRFTAQDAGTGRVSGSGTFDLAAARGFGIDLNVQAENAQLIGRDDIAATVTGPLHFRSDGSGGVISGAVVVNKGRYRLGRAAQAVAVPRLNIREINVPGGDDEDDTPRDPWRLDLDARIADGFVVQGLGLDSIWSGNLKIAGEPTNPRISGRLNLVRGDYEFAGREFDIDRGIINFDGSVPANPSLDIAANANTQGLNATIRVTGNAERPEIGFTSIPALPEDELLSRLLFGTSITSLSAPEALQLASAVAALNSGAGLDPINAVRRAAGLDRLRILPADPQTGAATAIAAGKYLTRRVYAEIISDGQGYSATRVEFQVTRWLSLLSSISTIGRQSANVRVSKDY